MRLIFQLFFALFTSGQSVRVSVTPRCVHNLKRQHCLSHWCAMHYSTQYFPGCKQTNMQLLWRHWGKQRAIKVAGINCLIRRQNKWRGDDEAAVDSCSNRSTRKQAEGGMVLQYKDVWLLLNNIFYTLRSYTVIAISILIRKEIIQFINESFYYSERKIVWHIISKRT